MQDKQQPGWTFTPGQPVPAQQVPQNPPAQPQPSPQLAPRAQEHAVTWTASEFIEHAKTGSWYAGLLFVAAVGIGIIYLITRDIFSVIALSLFAITFMIFAARKPKVLSYALTDRGIQVGERFYAFEQFRSFAVIDEGAFHSISLLPLKRFMPALSVYYAPEDETRIAQFLGAYLPHEDRKQDAVDRLMHKIRF